MADKVQTRIFWDCHNCDLPTQNPLYDEEKTPRNLMKNIRNALNQAKINCPDHTDESMQLFGFGDLHERFSNFRNIAVDSHRNVHIDHLGADVDDDDDDACDQKVLVEMESWMNENSPPANIVIITGDVDFCPAISMGVLYGYTTVVVCPQRSAKMMLNLTSHVLKYPEFILGSNEIKCEDERKVKPQVYTLIDRPLPQGNYPDVYICWDHFSCQVPDDYLRDSGEVESSYSSIAIQLAHCLWKINIFGKIRISVYGSITGDKAEGFSNSNVVLRFVEEANKSNVGDIMVMDILGMMHQSSTPSIFVLISNENFRSLAVLLCTELSNVLVVREDKIDRKKKESEYIDIEGVEERRWPDFLNVAFS